MRNDVSGSSLDGWLGANDTSVMAIASPPRPPTLEGSEALVREARARQRRRHLTRAAAVTVVAGIALISYAFADKTPPHPRAVAPAGARPASLSSCHARQLGISLVHTGAVMGEEGGLLRFTNLSQTSCSLAGWPTVVAVEASGKTVPSQHAVGGTMLFGWNWSQHRPVRKMTLMHGASAYAIIASADNPTSPNPSAPTRSCPKAQRLVITAPHSRGGVTLSAWLPGAATRLPLCAPQTEVSPILPRTTILH